MNICGSSCDVLCGCVGLYVWICVLVLMSNWIMLMFGFLCMLLVWFLKVRLSIVMCLFLIELLYVFLMCWRICFLCSVFDLIVVLMMCSGIVCWEVVVFSVCVFFGKYELFQLGLVFRNDVLMCWLRFILFVISLMLVLIVLYRLEILVMQLIFIVRNVFVVYLMSLVVLILVVSMRWLVVFSGVQIVFMILIVCGCLVLNMM